MIDQHLADAVRLSVDKWMGSTQAGAQSAELKKPAGLSQLLGSDVEQYLVSKKVLVGTLRNKILSSPYIHLQGVFKPGALPDTPQGFIPVPDVLGINAGRAAVLAVLGFLNFEAISYGTENSGDLFVNLVPMSGQGKFSEKSKKSMRGHTDGVSFPLNGDCDINFPTIAPSPDLVVLVGLRNPNEVATTVMPIDSVLGELSGTDIDELKKPQYSISSQATFVQGMKSLLGGEHVAIDVPVLKGVPGGLHIRYSHSSVVSTSEGNTNAKNAAVKLEAACNQVAAPVIIQPGDVVVVNNRLCLHGRGLVGNEVGGKARWLLRTYGLDTSNLDENRRHFGDGASHLLYP